MATELQILKHAKNYIDSLSNGVNPISGRPVPGDAALNQLRLKKCFAYVSTILQRAVEAGTNAAAFEGVDQRVLKHARGYIDSLSNGVDPLNRLPVPEDNALNQPKLKKCFAYVSGVLQKAVEAGEAPYAVPAAKTAPEKKPLEEEPEPPALLAEAGFPEGLAVSPETLSASQVFRNISGQMEAAGLKKVAWSLAEQWMRSEGLLVLSAGGNGKWIPGATAETAGFLPPLENEDTGISCTEQGQRFLCDHMAEILRYGQAQWDQLKTCFTKERLDALDCSANPVTITQIAENLNTLLPPDAERKVNAVNLSDWLEYKGFLSKKIQSGLKTQRVSSKKGRELGIGCKNMNNTALVYNKAAQRFVISNMPEILDFNRRLRMPPKLPKFYVPAGLNFQYSNRSIGFKIFQKLLNEALANCGGVPLLDGAVAIWLAQEGYLENARRTDGVTVRLPNAQGTRIGLEVGYYNGLEYTVCSEAAQHFLVEHLESIGALQNQALNPTQRPD